MMKKGYKPKDKPDKLDKPDKSLFSGLLLMVACTFFSAAGQMLFRMGARDQTFNLSLLFTNPFIIAGYIAFGLGGLLFLLALRQGELTVIYPFISMTFIWAAFFSLLILKERIIPLQLSGLAMIIMGVYLLMKGGRNG